MNTVSRFSSTAMASGAEVHTVSKESAEETLRELIETPAVSVPSSLDQVSLPSTVGTSPTQELLKKAKTGITDALIGIETLGSVVIPSDHQHTGPVSLFPERQIAVLDKSNIVPDIEAAFTTLGDRYRDGNNDTVIVTGPSSTGDMGELITGVHGPGELHIMVVCDE